MTYPIPDAALAQHMAVLGKTGSGKTSTAKLAIEHVVAGGARVCVLDPIKSDWWGLTSSADGRHAGLPFHILGGPHGHVQLHESSGKVIGELVATGALPLAIIDMALFNPGGHSKFFIDFAATLLRKVRGVVYLVMEEAHLFAPKERSGIGDENMAIHWAKMLATAGRSKGIRLVLVTQRTQALHNALLGSCDTLLAHRLTAPADQEPVVKWLKANVEKPIMEKVSASISSLPTGSAWLCSGEAKVFDLVKFPRIKTYDNTATPTGSIDDREITTAKVDIDRLRTVIGDAVKEAAANDPKALKAENARLTVALRKAELIKPAEHNAAEMDIAVRNATSAGYEAGLSEAARAMQAALLDADEAVALGLSRIREETVHLEEVWREHLKNLRKGIPAATTKALTKYAPKYSKPIPAHTVRRVEHRPNGHDTSLTQPQRRILSSVGFWRSVGTEAPTREQVAAVAGYKPSSGGFNNLIGGLKTAGLLDIPMPGRVSLSDGAPYDELTHSEAKSKMLDVLTGPQRKIVEAALSTEVATRAEIAQATDYSEGSGGFNNLIGSLCTIGILDKPTPGAVSVSHWAREVLS